MDERDREGKPDKGTEAGQGQSRRMAECATLPCAGAKPALVTSVTRRLDRGENLSQDDPLTSGGLPSPTRERTKGGLGSPVVDICLRKHWPTRCEFRPEVKAGGETGVRALLLGSLGKIGVEKM